MATIKLVVKVNGVPLEKSKDTLELFRDIVTIKNAGADTPFNALTHVKDSEGGDIPAQAVIATFEAKNEPSDVIEIFENDTLTGKTTFGKLVKYARFCLDRDNWMPETFGAKKEKTSAGGFDY